MTTKEAIQKHSSFGFKLLIELVVIIFAVGVAWATLRGDVVRNTDDIVKAEAAQTKDHDAISEVQGDIKSINTKIGMIDENIKEIKESVKK